MSKQEESFKHGEPWWDYQKGVAGRLQEELESECGVRFFGNKEG